MGAWVLWRYFLGNRQASCIFLLSRRKVWNLASLKQGGKGDDAWCWGHEHTPVQLQRRFKNPSSQRSACASEALRRSRNSSTRERALTSPRSPLHQFHGVYRETARHVVMQAPVGKAEWMAWLRIPRHADFIDQWTMRRRPQISFGDVCIFLFSSHRTATGNSYSLRLMLYLPRFEIIDAHTLFATGYWWNMAISRALLPTLCCVVAAWRK